MSAETPPEPDRLDARPPLLGSWRTLYGVVLGTLALLIAVFWTLTRIYGP